MTLRFEIADLNAIESRVGAWLSECVAMMDIFVPCFGPDGKWAKNGRDPYVDFAGKIYGRTYESIYLDMKSKDKVIAIAAKLLRQIAKPGFLAAIYRIAGGDWADGKGYKDHGLDCDAEQTGKKLCKCPMVYDRVRTGLWAYAHNMGIEMTQEQAHMVVRMFREAYKEICEFWTKIENSVLDVMNPEATATTRKIGPDGCVLIDRLNLTGMGMLMRMKLPSGRRLHYMDARIENLKMPWKKDGEDVWRPGLKYAGIDQVTKQWGTTTTHGGKLFENLVQGIARDILAVKLIEFEKNDLPVVAHVHDEGVCLVSDDPFSPNYETMVDIMSQPVSWAPGLLLGADGFEDSFYHK